MRKEPTCLNCSSKVQWWPDGVEMDLFGSGVKGEADGGGDGMNRRSISKRWLPKSSSPSLSFSKPFTSLFQVPPSTSLPLSSCLCCCCSCSSASRFRCLVWLFSWSVMGSREPAWLLDDPSLAVRPCWARSPSGRCVFISIWVGLSVSLSPSLCPVIFSNSVSLLQWESNLLQWLRSCASSDCAPFSSASVFSASSSVLLLRWFSLSSISLQDVSRTLELMLLPSSSFSLAISDSTSLTSSSFPDCKRDFSSLYTTPKYM